MKLNSSVEQKVGGMHPNRGSSSFSSPLDPLSRSSRRGFLKGAGVGAALLVLPASARGDVPPVPGTLPPPPPLGPDLPGTYIRTTEYPDSLLAVVNAQGRVVTTSSSFSSRDEIIDIAVPRDLPFALDSGARLAAFGELRGSTFHIRKVSIEPPRPSPQAEGLLP